MGAGKDVDGGVGELDNIFDPLAFIPSEICSVKGRLGHEVVFLNAEGDLFGAYEDDDKHGVRIAGSAALVVVRIQMHWAWDDLQPGKGGNLGSHGHLWLTSCWPGRLWLAVGSIGAVGNRLIDRIRHLFPGQNSKRAFDVFCE